MAGPDNYGLNCLYKFNMSCHRKIKTYLLTYLKIHKISITLYFNDIHT